MLQWAMALLVIGSKKIERLRLKTGLPIVIATVRGAGGKERVWILEDGKRLSFWNKPSPEQVAAALRS